MKKARNTIILLLSLCAVATFAFGCKSDTNGGSTPTPTSGTPSAAGTSNDTDTNDTITDDPAPTAAATAEPAPEVSVRDTLNIAVTGDAATLDPKDTRVYVRTFAEPLYDLMPDGTKYWKLATGLDEVSPTQLIFHLREGVTFSNGNPFNADDVLFTLDFLEHRENTPQTFPTLDWEVNPPKKIDDYTIELNFSSYDVGIMSNFVWLFIYDAETYDENTYSLNPVGTGPYTVTEYVVNSHLNLVANENYWEGPPKIKYVNYKVISESGQIVNALVTGTVDVAEIASSDVEYMKTVSGFDVYMEPTNSINAIWFNTSVQSVMNSHDARKAVCHAINSEAISNLVYYGNAQIPKWPLASSFLDFKESYTALDATYSTGYDPELAKAYAESSGLVNQTVRIITSGSSDDVTIAEIIQQNLKDIGVTAAINNYDMASYLDVTTDLSMYDFLIWEITAPSLTAAQGYYGWFTYQACFNQGTWEGIERFTELSNSVSTTFDNSEREAMIDEMTEILMRESFWFAFAETEVAVVVNSDLAGVDFMINRNSNFQNWAWVK